MLRALLDDILSRGLLERGIADRLGAIAREDWERVTERRDLFFVDVVVEIVSRRGDAVIGIKNKIDAEEGDRQIARYQGALRRAYDLRLCVLLGRGGRRSSWALLLSCLRWV